MNDPLVQSFRVFSEVFALHITLMSMQLERAWLIWLLQMYRYLASGVPHNKRVFWAKYGLVINLQNFISKSPPLDAVDFECPRCNLLLDLLAMYAALAGSFWLGSLGMAGFGIWYGWL